MGNEATCLIEVDGDAAEARVLLETEELVIRGPHRLKLPFSELRDVRATGDVLSLRCHNREIHLHLGAIAATRWAEKIRNPKSVLDKLGIKPGQKVVIIGALDASFAAEVSARAEVSTTTPSDADVVFFAAERRGDLDRLASIRGSLVTDGALWIIRPKGSAEISEAEVRNAGLAAGLVDVKVVRFSATHTAEKFVIPLAQRSKKK